MKLALIPLFMATSLWAEGNERLPGFTVPAPAADEVEIQTPILGEVKPGQEVMLCTYLDKVLDQDLFIEKYQAFQSPEGAHHAVLYTVKKQRAPGTYVCGQVEESMQEQTTFLAGTGGDAGGTTSSLPAGVLLRAAKGQQLMIQTHWMNYVGHPLKGQAVFHLKQRTPQPTDKIADFFFVSTSRFKLDPMDSKRTVQARCTMRDELTFFTTSGHMHEHGKHVTVSIQRANGERLKILDHNWNPHFTAVPPTYNQELALHPGDEVVVDCTYQDKLDKVLEYPTEMCGAVGFFYPAQKTMVCFDNVMQGD